MNKGACFSVCLSIYECEFACCNCAQEMMLKTC